MTGSGRRQSFLLVGGGQTSRPKQHSTAGRSSTSLTRRRRRRRPPHQHTRTCYFHFSTLDGGCCRPTTVCILQEVYLLYHAEITCGSLRCRRGLDERLHRLSSCLPSQLRRLSCRQFGTPFDGRDRCRQNSVRCCSVCCESGATCMANPVYTRVPVGICCVHTTSLAAIDLPRDEHDTHLLHTLFPSKY